MRTVRLLLASWVVMLTVTAPDFVTPDSRVLAQEPQRHIDPDADRILREMGEYLAAAAAFTFQADSSMDSVLRSGQWVTVGARSHVAAQRPDQLRVERHGDERHRRVVLNEGRFTMYDSERNVYAVADVPTAIDEAIDHMVETFGFSVPLSDLLAPNPYETLIANVETGFVVGRHAVDGVPCCPANMRSGAMVRKRPPPMSKMPTMPAMPSTNPTGMPRARSPKKVMATSSMTLRPLPAPPP